MKRCLIEHRRLIERRVAGHTARAETIDRDGGFTLVELMTTVMLIGVLAITLAGAITVIFNTEDGVGRIVGESHDELQLTNYLVADVQSGPYAPSAYVADPALASGCAATGPEDGYNVMRFDVVDAALGHTRRIAYRVRPASQGGARLDRFTCTDDGTGTFGQATMVNIADLLAPIEGTHLPVTVDVMEVAGVVRSVALGLERVDGSIDEVAASPRTGPAATASGSGVCPRNPFDDTSGFLAFVLDHVRLRDGADSYGAIATKSFSWANGARFSMGTSRRNDEWTLPGYAPDDMVALYVVDELDWDASAGMLELNSGGMVTVGDFTESVYDNAALGSNQTRVEPASGSSTAYVFNQSVGQRSSSNPVERSTSPLDMTGAFESIRDASDGLMALPGDCPQANHLTLLGQNGNGVYPGSGGVWVSYTSGNVNVLNVTMDDLRAIGNWNDASVARPGTSGTQLLINVADAGAVTFDAPILGLQNYPKHVMYNFPNATSITIPSGRTLWGSIVAPDASVSASGNDLRGNVIARELVVSGGVVDVDREYAGVFPWS